MNFSKSILLFNSSIRVIETIYDLDPAPGERKERAKRTLYKTLDPSIKKDDLVIIPTGTRYRRSIVKVTGVGIEIDDYESDGELLWIIGKFDEAFYNKCVQMEVDAVEVMRAAEKNKKREELRKSILDANPDLAKMSITNASFAAIEAPIVPTE